MENTRYILVIKKKKKKIIKGYLTIFAKNRGKIITRNILQKNPTVYIHSGQASITFKKKLKNPALYNHNIGELAPTKRTGNTIHLSPKNLKKKKKNKNN